MTVPQIDPATFRPAGARISRVEAAALREVGYKWCPKCQVTRPVEEFSRRSASWDGLAIYCRRCRTDEEAAARRHWRAKWADADPYAVATLKRCPDCGQTRPRVAYPLNRNMSDGLSPYCRECWAARASRDRDENRQRWTEERAYQNPTTRRCSSCSQHRPRRAFSLNSAAYDGLEARCRDCVNDRNALRRVAARGGGQTHLIDRSALLRETNGRCFYCGTTLAPGWHLDHVHALALQGEHASWNAVASCPRDNISKGAKAWPWVGFDPEGLNDAAPDAPFGYMIVYVLGVPYLGTVRLSAAEADAVEATEVVPDAEEDPEAPAPASPAAL